MHDTQMHVPTKPIDEGINTDGNIVDAEGDRGGGGGVNGMTIMGARSARRPYVL